MISKEEITKIANLSMLDLKNKEKEEYSEQISSLLEYFNQIRKLDLSGVEPTNHALVEDNVLREDNTLSSRPIDSILCNAPDTDKNNYKVPAIIETQE